MMDVLRKLLIHLHSSGQLDVSEPQLSKLFKKDEGGHSSTVADSPLRSLITDSSGLPCAVLFISSPISPDIMARNIGRAATAKAVLGEALGSVILDPIAEGTFEGLSFACWPWCGSLSTSSCVSYVQRRFLLKKLHQWHQGAMRSTKYFPVGDEITRGYCVSLAVVVNDDGFPSHMRGAASKGLKDLVSGKWRPIHALEHGDFWMGNILRAHQDRTSSRSHRLYPFTVIDWPGGFVKGYPFIDLMRLALSSGLPHRVLCRETRVHCQILEQEMEQVKYSILSALGSLGTRLEHFPRERYLQMGLRVFDAAVAVTS